MKVFSENHGNFVVATGSASTSVVYIKELGIDGDNCLFVQGFNATKAEKKSIVQCFGGTNHVYAFGHDPEGSNYSVTIGVFMSNCQSAEDSDTAFSSTGGIAKLVGKYNENKVSNHTAIVSMQIDVNSSLHGILTGMHVNSVDASLNMASVTFVFTDLDQS